MAQLASGRYATALFELAKSLNTLEIFEQQIKFISEVFNADRKILELIINPRITLDEKMTVIQTIFKGNIYNELLGFFHVIFKKNREKEISSIIDKFLEMCRKEKRITVAKVVSASALTDEHKNRIAEALKDKLNKHVEIQAEVDPTLIGGVKITVDGHVLDNTVRSQITVLKNQLLQMQIV